MNEFLPSMLFVLFLGLKLAGYITWSWVWVTAPLWVPPLILMPIILIYVFASGNRNK